jgi:hypothetical protein
MKLVIYELMCQVEKEKHVMNVESFHNGESKDDIDNADEEQVC